MPPKSFPPNFPSDLAVAALATGDDVAWPPASAALAVEWFGIHGYAVLGTELWLIKPDGAIQSLPTGTSGMREVHGNTVNRESGEPWNTFAARAAAETLAYLHSFNPADIVERGALYFNVVWVGESEYQSLVSA
jgi:hypothetical protein